VTGFRDVSRDRKVLDQLGLKPDDLNPPGTAFRAAVFERQSPPFAADETGYVVVFKGTTPGNLEDWRNNTRQGMDAHSPYYKQAVSIGKNVAEAVGDPANPAVSFTGHSLGGGLASAAAKASGLPANTFNAAGLNAATVARYGGTSQDADIFAYHVPGDPLTEANVEGVNFLGLKKELPLAAGTSQEVARAAADATIPPGQSDTYFHSMPVVTRAIEKRKAANEDRLKPAAAADSAAGT
jgi:type VI secretion system secreted protein VgrG